MTSPELDGFELFLVAVALFCAAVVTAVLLGRLG